MKSRVLYYIFILICLASILFPGLYSCKKETDFIKWPVGKYSKSEIRTIPGFPDQKEGLLTSIGLSIDDFVSISTDSAWHLSEADRNNLLELRNNVPFPNKSTILEKVIPLQDVATYMNNIYGGTIGGYISVASDLKDLSSMEDVYYGLRLDYPNTKFLVNGAGYSVIRFTSSFTANLSIPYCEELGGTIPHSWPNTGGGFTSSTLGDGGYPEYRFDNYFVPDQGGELYEVTPLGNEILRATFEGDKWKTTEPDDKSSNLWVNPLRNGLFGLYNGNFYPLIFFNDGKKKIVLTSMEERDYDMETYCIETYSDYLNCSLRTWGFDGDNYLVTTTDYDLLLKLNLDFIEKGIYGKVIPINAVKNIHETINIVSN